MQEHILKKQVLEEQKENIEFKIQKLKIQVKGIEKSIAKLEKKILEETSKTSGEIAD